MLDSSAVVAVISRVFGFVDLSLTAALNNNNNNDNNNYNNNTNNNNYRLVYY